ncbi:hypothetical protein BJF78_20160 [Pseudonocardia sp. CNS-139]|nr:hypothetical protein BJF78_20160 [Pseudonocardia sp. CNS-139]
MGLQSATGRGAAARPRRQGDSSAVRTARALEDAEHDAQAAAARCEELRAAAAAVPAARGPLESWQQLLLLILGGGLMVGVMLLWLLTTMYLATCRSSPFP